MRSDTSDFSWEDRQTFERLQRSFAHLHLRSDPALREAHDHRDPGAHGARRSSGRPEGQPHEWSRRPLWKVSAAAGALVVAVSGFALRYTGITTTVVVASNGAEVVLPQEQINGELVFPVPGRASFADTFGSPRQKSTGDVVPNDGISVFAASGSAVIAMRAAHVASVSAGGNEQSFDVVLADRDGTEYTYRSLVGLSGNVVVGANLRTGERVGRVGRDTGRNDLAILGFAIRSFDRTLLNPYVLLRDLQRRSTGTAESPSDEMVTVSGISVRRDFAPWLTKLLTSARAAGIELGGSGFRSSVAQVALRRKNCGQSDYNVYILNPSECKPPTARPGNSGHELGRAVDFAVDGQTIALGDRAHRWLVENADKLRVTNPSPNEPWHWEFSPAKFS